MARAIGYPPVAQPNAMRRKWENGRIAELKETRSTTEVHKRIPKKLSLENSPERDILVYMHGMGDQKMAFKSRCYCINLRRAALAVTKHYDRALKPTGLSANQFSLLINLSRVKSASVSTLAETVGLERTTLARTLKPLLAKMLVADTSGAAERDRKLEVTPLGWQVIETALPLWEQAQQELADRIGNTNVPVLIDLLARLIN